MYRILFGAWLFSVVLFAIEWMAGVNQIVLSFHASVAVISTIHLARLLSKSHGGEGVPASGSTLS
jgi:hypothetical protein